MSDILDIGSSKSKFATHSAENFMPSPNFMIPAVPNVRRKSINMNCDDNIDDIYFYILY
jgi:hypothetical protein